MRQLALDVRLADHAVFGNFTPGTNVALVDSLRRAAAGEGLSPVWCWGAQGSGKSHLLQASVAAAHERGAAAAYLPLRGLRSLTADILDGMAGLELVAIDDVSCVAGEAHWEAALFRLYEGLVPRGGHLVLAADVTPAQAGFRLPDLASRMAAGVVYRLQRLTDEEWLQALQRRALWRGFELPEETGRYLLGRVARGAASLFGLLDQLDRAALLEQKRLTIPFVRRVIDAESAE
jgi:DnaA family protein